MTVWSSVYKPSYFTLFSGDLQVLDTGGSSSTGILPGKALSDLFGAVGQYFEITVDFASTTGSGTPENCAAIGIANLSSNLSLDFSDGNGFGWYADGWFQDTDGTDTYIGTGFATGDQLGIHWYSSGRFDFYKGATLVHSYTGALPSGDLYAAVYLRKNPEEVTANFGATSFAHAPSGATGWGVAGSSLPARNITYNKTLPGLLQLASVLSGSPEPPPPTFGTGGFFPDTIAEILAGRTVICELLVFMDFQTTPMRLWQGFGTLITNDANEWQGIGQLGQVGDLESSIGGTSPKAEFTLSGVDPGLIADALDAENEINNRDVNVYIQFFNANYTCLDNPYVVWAGIMDTMRIKQAGPDKCTVEVSAETIFARRSLPPLGILSDREHQQFYPGDTGLALIPTLMSKVASWPVILPGYP